jgi:hypothetical protein
VSWLKANILPAKSGALTPSELRILTSKVGEGVRADPKTGLAGTMQNHVVQHTMIFRYYIECLPFLSN